MEQVCEIVKEKIERYSGQQVQFVEKLDCHHNFAALEEHFGEKVWVHRKGAVRAKQGERVIIPGAMGSYSYIAEGTGNEEAFHSCSHGAGRLYSRTQAMAAFSTEKVILDLREQGVVLGKRNKKDVAEESRFAYKDIEGVMQQQRDLVISIRRMKTLGVVKG
jgi:tRNA-splicing ligase RtcB (3'-phosphate/5'-hydroxy nucleic acid ligase)